MQNFCFSKYSLSFKIRGDHSSGKEYARMPKFRELIHQVYLYEKGTAIENKYLSNVLFWFAFMIFAINYFNNSLDTNPGIYIFCLIITFLCIWDAVWIRKAKNLGRLIKTATLILLLSSIYCIYYGGNDGFQNLWFFIAPCILLILIGLPFGLPCCTIYGIIITVLFWTPLCEKMAYPYSLDYRFYYPVLYWSFCLLIFIADLFYKKYRIDQEKEEEKMEAEVAATIEDAQKLMLNSVTAIGRMIDEKDNYTREHSQRVADYSRLIAKQLKSFPASEKELDQIYRSALLHDIGKIAIPDAILKKTSRLTDEEYAIMKTHPVWGKKILAGLSFLPQADYGASYHHERYDGKGYPEGIRTDELPAIVKIISAADALDAMNSNRCYRKHCSRSYIIGEFEKGSGTQFDPEVAQTVIELIRSGQIEIPEEEKGDNA